MGNNTNDMTVGNPTRGILHFALPLILGYILQQMYLIIDAAIVGRWLGVNALAAVGASSSIMFLVMGFATAHVPDLPYRYLKHSAQKTMGK